MKLLRILVCFLVITMVSFFIIYGENKQNDWINRFTETFELTNSNFKFYNVKANLFIDREISIDDLEKLCEKISKIFDIKEENIDFKKNQKGIYVKFNSKDLDFSIVAKKENDKESYIIVDILNNKGYKNIEQTYEGLDEIFKNYSNDYQIDVCMAGEYTKKLQKNKCDDILDKILYNMYAKEISRVEYENFLSVNAYSKLLEDNDLLYLNEKMNLNIGIRYSEDDDKTMIYIATPIIKIDY